MKRIELIWNIVHYFAYLADYKFHLCFNKINPFLLISRVFFQKKIYERKGINIEESLDFAFKDPENGLSSMRAGGFMFILSFLIGATLFFLTQAVCNSTSLSSV